MSQVGGGRKKTIACSNLQTWLLLNTFGQDIKIVQTPQKFTCFSGTTGSFPTLFISCLRSILCQENSSWSFLGIQYIPKSFISLYLGQIFTKSLRSFSYVFIALILILLSNQNLLFYWGTGPIEFMVQNHRNPCAPGNTAPNRSDSSSTFSYR